MNQNPSPLPAFQIQLNAEEVAAYQSSFIVKVYAWMTFGLLVTAIISFFTINTPGVLMTLAATPLLFFGMLIGEVVLVIFITRAAMRMNSLVATLAFIFYAGLNGVTMALIIAMYTASSVASTFMICAATFALMSLYGYTTKRDLTSWGNILVMALLGFVVASVVNIFLASSVIYWITTYAGILIFVGLIAYDTQKIKGLALVNLAVQAQATSQTSDLVMQAAAATEAEQRGAIVGALILYLDFINLFLLMLRIFGRRR